MIQKKNITRLEQGTHTHANETVDLTELVKNVCKDQPYPPERLICRTEPAIHVQADEALIMRLLQNLIDNGFKYGKPEGHVWVSLERDSNEVRNR